MELVSTVLHFREGHCLVFRWKCSRMLTNASHATDRRSVSGGAIMCEGAASVCWFSSTQK